jgi:hypothetical protein
MEKSDFHISLIDKLFQLAVTVYGDAVPVFLIH